MANMYASPSIRAAQAVGITSAAILSGSMFSISIMAVPALLVAQPRTTLKQWTNMYDLGRVTSPPSVLFSSLAFFYLAYRTHPATTYLTGENEWTIYLAAGTVVGAVLPFSVGVMERTNQELLRFGTPREGGKEPLRKEDEDRIRVLIGRWKVLNLVRSVMLAIGAGIGVYAVERYYQYEVKQR